MNHDEQRDRCEELKDQLREFSMTILDPNVIHGLTIATAFAELAGEMVAIGARNNVEARKNAGMLIEALQESVAASFKFNSTPL